MENYYVRILTKNMRNVYVEAHRRAMKEYYPPHLTGPGSRGVGLLDMVFFGPTTNQKHCTQNTKHCSLKNTLTDSHVHIIITTVHYTKTEITITSEMDQPEVGKEHGNR